MKGFPWIKWFPPDWIKSTRMLTLAAKGAWTDIIMALHDSPTYGQMTLPIESWARVIGATPDETGNVLTELKNTNVANVELLSNGNVTVGCRRLLREENEREKTRQRVARHRERSNKETDETPELHGCNGDGNENGTALLRGRGTEARSTEAQRKTERRAVALPDDAWISSLKSDPAYRGIDVDREVAKCRRWCEEKRKNYSRSRVINWLNRSEPSMNAPTAPIIDRIPDGFEIGPDKRLRRKQPIGTPVPQQTFL